MWDFIYKSSALIISFLDPQKKKRDDVDRIIKLENELLEEEKELKRFIGLLKTRKISYEFLNHELSKEKLDLINTELERNNKLNTDHIRNSYHYLNFNDDQITVKGVHNKGKNIFYNLTLVVVYFLLISPIISISIGDYFYSLNEFHEKLLLLIISLPTLVFGIVGFNAIKPHFNARRINKILQYKN